MSVKKKLNSLIDKIEDITVRDLPKYFINPLFWLDVSLKSCTLYFITYMVSRSIDKYIPSFAVVDEDIDGGISSKSPVWKIVLDLYIQIMLKTMFAFCWKALFKTLFDKIDFFPTNISNQAWNASSWVASTGLILGGSKMKNLFKILMQRMSLD
jgi:hypothetical protein